MSSKNVKAARESLGLSQKVVAEYLGSPQSTISKIETGAINPGNITARNIVALSEILKAPVEYLIREEPARISIDGGLSWTTPEKAIGKTRWEEITTAMDSRFRRIIEKESTPCSELEYLTKYLEIAIDDIIVSL